MKKSFRLICLLLVSVLLLGMMVGCAQKPAAEEPPKEAAASGDVGEVYEDVSGTVTVWIYGDYENRLEEEFNKMYPNVKMNFVLVDANEAPKKLQTILASEDYSELPDVVSLEVASRGQMINLDIWEVLDEEPYSVKQSDLLDIVLPKLVNDKGQLVCLPLDNCVGNIYYKRDLAEKYLGTSDSEVLAERLQTWDDFLTLANELSGKMGDGEYMLAGATEIRIPMMNQVVEATVQNGKFVKTEEYEALISMANKMQKTGVIGQMEWESAAYWASTELNNVMFYPTAAWFIPDVIKQGSEEQQGNWGVLPAPSGGYMSGGSACAIPSTSENKEAAFAWLQFLSLTMEGSAAWRDINGVLNCNKEAFETEGFYSGETEWFGGQDALAVVRESAMKTPAMMPLTPYDTAIRGALIQTAVKIMNEDISDEDAFAVFYDSLYSVAPELK